MFKKHRKPNQTLMAINRDGSLNIDRPRRWWRFFTDLSHIILSISWPKFFLILIAFFFSTNLLFGALYYFAGPLALNGAHPQMGWERFWDCFFFSALLFNGPFHPKGVLMNALVVAQSYLGILSLVIITGILYTRFARPSARVIFSDNAIINKYNGQPCFVFRVANERLNQIIEARMTLTLSKNVTSKEGETSRKFFNMKLECDYSPLFALSWTIRHYINEDSPLWGMDEEKMANEKVVIFASLSGLDDSFSQTINARSVYRFDEVVYNKYFKDILHWQNNKIHINLKGIHDTQ